MKITTAMLRMKKACESHVLEFERRFPNGIEVTEEVCLSVADIFNWNWAARNFLSWSAKEHYDLAIVIARVALNRACAPALADFDRIVKSVGEDCANVIAPAWADCRLAMAPAQADFARAAASAFAKGLRDLAEEVVRFA